MDIAERKRIARWLLGWSSAPGAHVLRRARLAAYAYTVLPLEHALRPAVRPDFLAAVARHHQIKREILPLLSAWRSAGIDVLLFKGFYLAEFVYAAPGARFHGDVDVVIRPEQSLRAVEIARALGWHDVGPPGGPAFSHCAFVLVRRGGATMIDMHRWALTARLPWSRVQRRITEAVWGESRTRSWEGIEVREPSAVDALLVGVVLNRCWSADEWRLKPFDLVDFQQLSSCCGIDREALWLRARQLRCDRTLALFLGRCDPNARRFDLSPLSHAQRRRRNWAVFRERGLLGQSERRLARILHAPSRVVAGAAFVPTVLRIRHGLHGHTDIQELLRSLTPPTDGMDQAVPGEPRRVTSQVRWAMRLVGTGPHSSCLLRSLAIYSILRKRGWPVELVSGVRRDGGGIVGHAWVELDNVVLWELREPENRAIYRESFRFPGQVQATQRETSLA